MDYPYDVDAALTALSVADPVLGQLITRVGPYQLELRVESTLFQALLRSIIYQQLSGRAAGAIHERVCNLYKGRYAPTPRQVINTPDDVLRTAGLSRNKVIAVKDLASKSLHGVVPNKSKLQKLSDEDIIAKLVEVRGIGRWTVEMLLMFHLGRPNVLPTNDLGIQKGFQVTYGKRKLPDAKTLTKHAKCWQPYRTVACWYLWRAADTVL